MGEKVRFGLLLNEKEALALEHMAQGEGESRAAILRRLVRAEAERRGIRPADLVRQALRQEVRDAA